jgi:hypothetical protein
LGITGIYKKIRAKHLENFVMLAIIHGHCNFQNACPTWMGVKIFTYNEVTSHNTKEFLVGILVYSTTCDFFPTVSRHNALDHLHVPALW